MKTALLGIPLHQLSSCVMCTKCHKEMRCLLQSFTKLIYFDEKSRWQSTEGFQHRTQQMGESFSSGSKSMRNSLDFRAPKFSCGLVHFCGIHIIHRPQIQKGTAWDGAWVTSLGTQRGAGDRMSKKAGPETHGIPFLFALCKGNYPKIAAHCLVCKLWMIIICSDGMVPEAINKEIYMEIDHLVIKHGWDLAPSFCSGRIIHINNEWPDGDDSSYSGCHIGWDLTPFGWCNWPGRKWSYVKEGSKPTMWWVFRWLSYEVSCIRATLVGLCKWKVNRCG